MKSILLIGQSNMAGRGYIQDVPQILNENLFMLRNGRWQMMVEPIHYDRSVAGVGPAASFAELWTQTNQDQLGLIPCAEGGSSIDEWNIDGRLFRHTITEAKFALEDSELIAILWHQGESDCLSGKYKQYNQKLKEIESEIRTQLGVENIPFIIGGMPDFLGKSGFGLSAPEYQQLDQQLQLYTQENENCYYVSAQGLMANGDGIHIDGQSQRIFGVRYYQAFTNLTNIDTNDKIEQQLLTKCYDRKRTAGEIKYIALEEFTVGKTSFEDLMKVLS